MEEPTPILSYGGKAAGVSFNPSQDPHVKEIKGRSAWLIDLFNDLRNNTEDPEVKRMLSVAITELQTAQMWAVKAVTWSK